MILGLGGVTGISIKLESTVGICGMQGDMQGYVRGIWLY